MISIHFISIHFISIRFISHFHLISFHLISFPHPRLIFLFICMSHRVLCGVIRGGLGKNGVSIEGRDHLTVFLSSTGTFFLTRVVRDAQGGRGEGGSRVGSSVWDRVG